MSAKLLLLSFFFPRGRLARLSDTHTSETPALTRHFDAPLHSFQASPPSRPLLLLTLPAADGMSGGVPPPPVHATKWTVTESGRLSLPRALAEPTRPSCWRGGARRWGALAPPPCDPRAARCCGLAPIYSDIHIATDKRADPVRF